jgi:hypothetical protein
LLRGGFSFIFIVLLNFKKHVLPMRIPRLFAIVLLSLVSRTLYGVDPSVSVYVDHGRYTAAHVYEFDIMMVASSPTSSFQLRTFQAGLYLNSSWVGGGTIIAQNASGYSEMSGQGYNGSFQWNPTDKLVNCSVNYDVLGPVTCIATTVGSTPVVVTKVRLTNSVDYSCASAPDIKFNYVANKTPLRLRTTFSWREVACTINYEMFYPGRTYTGTAKFNNETFSLADADGKSNITTGSGNAGFCESELTVGAFLEGYYLGAGQMQPVLKNTGIAHAETDQADSIIIELRNPSNNALLVTPPIHAVLSTSGKAYCILPNSLIGTSCWIVIKHRQSIETWSANPVTLASRTSFSFAQ